MGRGKGGGRFIRRWPLRAIVYDSTSFLPVFSHLSTPYPEPPFHDQSHSLLSLS